MQNAEVLAMPLEKTRGKFVELAEKRVNRAIKDLQLIGNLANRHNYQYTQRDADSIIGALEAELRTLKAKFRDQPENRRGEFRLARD